MESEHRLHPSSVFFSIVGALRSFVVPVIIAIVVARSFASFWLMLAVIPAMIAGTLHYISYRYRLTEEELIIRQGILLRKVRHVPFTRIQNVNLVRNPLHRMFGVAEVQLETASGDKPEAVMRVLSMDAVRELRQQVDADTVAPSVTSTTPASTPLVQLSLREVALYGLISNRGLVLVGAVLGVASQFEWWEVGEEQVKQIPALLERFLQIEAPPLWLSIVTGVALALIIIVALALLSTAWGVMRYHGFKLTRRMDRLRTEYGLFTRIQATIPLQRVQLLATRQGPLQRLFNRVSVLAKTAGSTRQSSDPDESTIVRRPWLAPIFPAQKMVDLIEAVLPETRWHSLEWRPLAPRAEWRIRKRLIIVFSLIALPLTLLLKVWVVPLWILAVLWASIYARKFVLHSRWALGDRVVLFRRGWWFRRMAVVRIDKIQGISIRETPFDRRHKMASLCIDTAGSGAGWRTVDIPLIPAETAALLRDQLYLETSRTDFRW
ncbi:MAG: PH domain-containing protein [Acidobacteriota bacterium]|nr:PH domain-containing protein [Acidobacteriota bacterium]MDH3784967.1 PH domain-containing protein [Acidobacteriota bacterium]